MRFDRSLCKRKKGKKSRCETRRVRNALLSFALPHSPFLVYARITIRQRNETKTIRDEMDTHLLDLDRDPPFLARSLLSTLAGELPFSLQTLAMAYIHTTTSQKRIQKIQTKIQKLKKKLSFKPSDSPPSTARRPAPAPATAARPKLRLGRRRSSRRGCRRSRFSRGFGPMFGSRGWLCWSRRGALAVGWRGPLGGKGFWLAGWS